MFMSRERVESLRKQYPAGTRVVLQSMDDFQAPPSGTQGEVVHVDDIGQIHVSWDNGSGLALNPDVDRFFKIDKMGNRI